MENRITRFTFKDTSLYFTLEHVAPQLIERVLITTKFESRTNTNNKKIKLFITNVNN